MYPPPPNMINLLNADLSPICHLLALLGAHYIFHVSGLRVKSFLSKDVSTYSPVLKSYL